MRQGPLLLLLILSLSTPLLQADEAVNEPVLDRQAQLEQRLSENLEQRNALKDDLEAAASAAGRAQLTRLRQENQRLRMQLEQGQSKVQPQLLNDQQQWFAVGGGVGVLGFLLGVLTTRGRRRRQWLN